MATRTDQETISKVIEFLKQSRKRHKFTKLFSDFSEYVTDSKASEKLEFDRKIQNYKHFFLENDIAIDTKAKEIYYKINIPRNIIYYGAPGTGKSRKVKDELGNIDANKKFRTMFHEEYSYFDFVGQYKPVIYHESGGTSFYSPTGIKMGDKFKKPIISYEFTPGIFLKAYTEAYRTKDDVYLIIEELNRGNCSSIFGDIFQLLDRNESGESEYPICPSEELKDFLHNQKIEVMPKETLIIPKNLKIIATMNTSDQSLFPIDSAFKRRWSLEFIPIDLTDKSISNLEIDGNEKIKWVKFVKIINQEIYKSLNSENKQIGQYFLKKENSNISFYDFKNKLMHYLYFDVFKHHQSEIFGDKTFSEIIQSKTIKKMFVDEISKKL
jgi:5-methylcytosine-specific restriction endonuclease McrBC GTP-binding regulatory subunit McrB